MIALTLGTVAELQLRVVGVRAAADLAPVAVAPLRLRPLLLPDGGLELDGLPGALAALDTQQVFDVLPEEDHKVQYGHHGSQRAGIRAVGQGSDNVPAKQGNIRPRQPLGFQGDHHVKHNLRVRVKGGKGQKQGQIDVIRVRKAPAVIARSQRQDHRRQHAEDHAAEIIQGKLSRSPFPLQRAAHKIVKGQHDKQRQRPVGKGQQHKGHQPPYLAVKQVVEVKFQKAQRRRTGKNGQGIRHGVGNHDVKHEIWDAEPGMAVSKSVDPLIQFLQNETSCHSYGRTGNLRCRRNGFIITAPTVKVIPKL